MQIPFRGLMIYGEKTACGGTEQCCTAWSREYEEKEEICHSGRRKGCGKSAERRERAEG